MPSITTWTRLEPRPRSADMRQSLQARLHDPLWLLARQWQLGEFQGEDTGSPCRAALVAEVSVLSRFLPKLPHGNHSQEALDYAPVKKGAAVPLETLVERETGRRSTDYHAAAEAGLHFLRLLGPDLTQKYRGVLLKAFALEAGQPDELDAGSARFDSVVVRRVIDGVKLRAQFAKPRPEGAELELPGSPFPAIEPGSDQDAFLIALAAWLDWYGSLFSEPNGAPAWQAERLEYAFSVSAASSATGNSEAVLVAQEYTEGRLDWYSFDQDAEPNHRLGVKDALSTTPPITMLPTPMRFRGMPAARFWEFEDASVDFANLEVAREDLSRLLLMEFALIYGNDFFMIPMDLAVGSLCRITSFKVKDTFGEEFTIPAAQADTTGSGTEPPWRMYCLSLSPTDGLASDFFFLPPVLGPMLESRPIEEVVFARDEMANLVWAIEQTVHSHNGRPVSRAESFQRKRQRELDRREAEQPGATAPTSGPLEYRLFTEVPEYWKPLSMDTAGLLKLNTLNPPLGVVLADFLKDANLRLHEEEIPREGMHVTRSFQYTRWVDGSTHLWIGRRKQPGRGEGSSGLRFDVAEPAKISNGS